MYEGNPGEIDFGSSQCEVQVSEDSSYKESAVLSLFSYLFSACTGRCMGCAYAGSWCK